MNRMIKTALLVVVGAALAAPAFAQSNFPDAPENHWAYQALENLKREGILVGYPDGTYKGSRDLTRYELAVALNAAYQRLKMMDDGLADQIAEIKKQIEGMGGGSDNKPLLDRLTALENQVKGLSRLNDDMAAMKRMADEFQKELASLGVDVEEMKKNIADLMKGNGGSGLPVSVSGDANIMMLTGINDNGSAGAVGWDGRIYGQDAAGNTVRWHNALNIYHELAVKLSGGGNGVPNWRATLVYGNLLGPTNGVATGGFGNQSSQFGGTSFMEGPGDVYIQEFSADIDNGFAGMPFKATIGRQGWQSHNSYLFKRTDFTPYFQNERWDNGNWMFDGIMVDMNFGAANVNIFGGRNTSRFSTNGVELQPLGGGTVGIAKNTVGAEVSFKAGEVADISLDYLLHSENNQSLGAADRLEVYGGDISLNIVKDIAISGGYGKSTLRNGSTAINNTQNQSFWAKAAYDSDNWGVYGGYRAVEQNYIAFGDWERIGTFYNPNNIQNWMVGGHFNFNDKLSLHVDGEIGEIDRTVGAFTAGDDIVSAKAWLNFGVNDYWKVMAGYEDVKIDLVGADIRQKWASLGFGYMMGKNSTWNLMYQWGDVSSPAGVTWGGAPAGAFKGHIITSNLSIKF